MEEAQEFSEFFTNIPNAINTELQKTAEDLNINIETWERTYNQDQHQKFNFKPVSADEILKFFSKSSKKSVGVDGISYNILKLASPSIAQPLTSLINHMISTSKFPSDLKISKINPIYKKGDKNLKSNYRPISILPSISKLFERILNNQLNNHLETNSLYDNMQSGFRKKHSTNTALLYMVDSWIKNMDSGKITGVLALDLSKAFDCLSHSSISSAFDALLHSSASSTKLITDYLTDHKACVYFNSNRSSLNSINDGVPQGSILGPTLFISALTDIKNILGDINYHIYADDLTIWTSDKDPQKIISRLEEVSQKIFKYFAGNGLKLNIDKTQFMYIGTVVLS